MAETTTNNENKGVSLASLSEGAIPTASPVMPKTATPMTPPLPRFNANEVKDVNRREVAQAPEREQPVDGTGNPMIDQAFESIDPTIERLNNESLADFEKGQQERIDAAIDNDSDDDAIDRVTETQSQTLKVKSFVEPVNSTTDEPTTTSSHLTRKHTRTIDVSDTITPEDEAKRIAELERVTQQWSGNEESKDDDQNRTTINTVIDDDDLGLLDDDDDETEDTSSEDSVDEDDDETKKENEIREQIRMEMKKNFNPVKKVDLSQFTVSKKPVSAGRVINHIAQNAIECADGVIYSEKRAIRMSAFTPVEIQSLDPQRLRGGNYNSYMDNKMRLVYNHIIDDNKPATFEAWAKITPNTSLDDYFFTAYKATFGESNILTFNCSDNECSNVFMKSRNVHDMIKFRNDEVKEQYFNILRHGNTNSGRGEYKVGLYQASDEYVFGLKQPSLYNTFIETSLVDDKFMKKYEDLLLLLSYVDCIYLIDKESKQLIPIDTKADARDASKTYKRRIKTFAAIINTLNSDQLQALSVATDDYDGGKLNDDGTLEKDVTYIYPSETCPKCHKAIKEQVVAPDNMLFTRHQLGLMSKI